MSRGLAVVTGATAGIGREFGEQLAARGYDLLLVARDRQRLEGVRDAITSRYGVAAEDFPADLSVETDTIRLAGRLTNSPTLSLLVNNAGFGSRGTLLKADPERQAAMVRLHALTPLRLCQAALPVLVRNGTGGIINVSSVAGFIYSPGNANYCATKAYLTNVTEGLAAELVGTAVRVQALCPGFTRSEFHQRMAAPRPGPSFLWMEAADVVRTSLWALDRGGPTVCIPGLQYRIIVGLIRLLPRWLLGAAGRLRRDRHVT